MKIGYCVPVLPSLASYRLRVEIPSKHLGIPHAYGVGDVTFFFKNGSPEVARRLQGPIVYDVVNAHFDDPDYRKMIERADVITCSSWVMAEMIYKAFGREAVVIADPYENEEKPARVEGGVLWFGHQANLASLRPYTGLSLTVCSGSDWSREAEDAALEECGVVLLTASNPGASANRVVKALRAGRFVVVPVDCPESWKDLAEFIWIGDVRRGIEWTFANREEACLKVQSAQKFIRKAFSPQSIGSQWAELFASTWDRATNKKTAGSALTSR